MLFNRWLVQEGPENIFCLCGNNDREKKKKMGLFVRGVLFLCAYAIENQVCATAGSAHYVLASRGTSRYNENKNGGAVKPATQMVMTTVRSVSASTCIAQLEQLDWKTLAT